MSEPNSANHSCPAGNNVRKIGLVTLRAFHGLLSTSAGFKPSLSLPVLGKKLNFVYQTVSRREARAGGAQFSDHCIIRYCFFSNTL